MSFRRGVEVDNLTIGSFINASTGQEVTSGVPTGTYLKDGVPGTLSGTITYDPTSGLWQISKLTATEMNGVVIGLKFSLAGCLPISFSIKTELSDNLTINPANVTVQTGQVSSNDLIAYENAKYTYTFSITDQLGNPVNLSGKSLSFIVFDSKTMATIYTLTTAGGQISIGGTYSNQITVQSPSSNTTVPGISKWVLRNTTDVTVLATGTLNVVAEA